MRKIALLFICLFAMISSSAQPPKAAEAAISIKRIDKSVIELVINLTPAEGFHIYSFIPTAEKGGPRPFEINVGETPGVESLGKPASSVPPVNEMDSGFGMKVNFWNSPVIIRQRYKITDKSLSSLKGYIRFQGCNGDMCTPPKKQSFNLTIPSK